MQLLAAGLNHHTAPLALRERVALSGARLDAALGRLRSRTAEGFVLSTCNRTEWYALVGHAGTGAELLLALLAEGSGVHPDELAAHLEVHAHESAVLHLFRVAAGLDSMVPGEDQIVAQLKAALVRAERAGTLGATMHRLGAAALTAGKRVRHETGLSRHSLSVVSAALQLATDRLGGGTLKGTRALVVGAGSTAELALKHLTGSPGVAVTLVSRTRERGEELAAMYGASYTAWPALDEALCAADLVLSCTSAPDVVIGVEALRRAVRARTGGAPLLVCDLAVPRDVEAAAASIDGVTLWDIDGLQAVCDANRKRRLAEIERAEALVAAEAERFMMWWSAREVAPTITALLAHADAIQGAEVERMLARLTDIGDAEAARIRALVARVVRRLLHSPLRVLKTDPEGANMAQVVQQLFGLQIEGAGGVPGVPGVPLAASPPVSVIAAPHGRGPAHPAEPDGACPRGTR